MKTFTPAEARQKLASLLEQAANYGEVRIKRRDGQVFVVKPQKRKGSPLDIGGIKKKLKNMKASHRQGLPVGCSGGNNVLLVYQSVRRRIHKPEFMSLA
jgi:hypothetical protein